MNEPEQQRDVGLTAAGPTPGPPRPEVAEYLVIINTAEALPGDAGRELARMWRRIVDQVTFPAIVFLEPDNFVLRVRTNDSLQDAVDAAWTRLLQWADAVVRQGGKVIREGLPISKKHLRALEQPGVLFRAYEVAPGPGIIPALKSLRISRKPVIIDDPEGVITIRKEGQQPLGEYLATLRTALRSDSELLLMATPPPALTEEYAQQQTRIGRERVEVLAKIALRTLQAEALRIVLSELVDDARDLGATWSDIGRAAGTSPQAAHRRWDDDAREKHREYEKTRRQGQSAGDEHEDE